MPTSSSDSEGTSPPRRRSSASRASSTSGRRPAARSRRSTTDEVTEAPPVVSDDDFGSGVEEREARPTRERRPRPITAVEPPAAEAAPPAEPRARRERTSRRTPRATSESTETERPSAAADEERRSSRFERQIADVEPQTGMRYFSTDELDFGDDPAPDDRPPARGRSRHRDSSDRPVSDAGPSDQAPPRSDAPSDRGSDSGFRGRRSRFGRSRPDQNSSDRPMDREGSSDRRYYSDRGYPDAAASTGDREGFSSADGFNDDRDFGDDRDFVDADRDRGEPSGDSNGPNGPRFADGDRRPRRRRRRRRGPDQPGPSDNRDIRNDGPRYAGPRDAGPRDAGPRDSGNRDNSRRDSRGPSSGGGGRFNSNRNDGRNSGGRGRGGRPDSAPRGGGGGRDSGRRRGGDRDVRRVRAVAPSTEVIEGTFDGVLELHDRGYGFLRDPKKNYAAEDSNPFVSSSLVEKYKLREGVLIRGQVGQGTRNQGPRLHEVELIDGFTPEEYLNVKNFDTLTPINPFEQIKLEVGPRPLTMRVMDLLCPIGKGQRALLVAPPRTGKTMLLQDIANSVSINHPEIHLMVLLIDERPEEVTEMRRMVKGEVISSTLDSDLENHIRLSELIIERAKRLAEEGKDVFILLDSITRLARAFNKANNSGRTGTGGLDIRAMDIPKKLFGQARRFDEGGSLTVCGTALIDTGGRIDEAIFQEFKGTGNMEMVLSRELADRRIWPSIDITKSGTRREEKILAPDLLEGITMLRRSLVSLSPVEAMEQLTKTMERFPTNREFLSKIKALL